jgi:hypothetical protein
MSYQPRINYLTQFAILLCLIGGALIIGSLITIIVSAKLLHVSFFQVQDALMQPENGQMIGIINAISSVFILFLPAYFFAKIVNKKPFKHLGFHANLFNIRQVLIVFAITYMAIMLSGALGTLNMKIPLPKHLLESFKKAEEKYDQAVFMIAQMNNTKDFIVALIVMAFVPAVCEEVIFRGAIQQLLVNWIKIAWVAILITSIIFSAIHFSYFGFLPRLALGMVLGYIFYYTKNLWLNILMHFLNNAMVVVQLYFASRHHESLGSAMDDSLPIWWGIFALIILVLLFIALKKECVKIGADRIDNTYCPDDNPFA